MTGQIGPGTEESGTFSNGSGVAYLILCMERVKARRTQRVQAGLSWTRPKRLQLCIVGHHSITGRRIGSYGQ